jgi:hypothetical protein
VLLVLAGFVSVLLQTFLPMIGSQWQPQGTCVFPCLMWIARLFAFGIRPLTRRLDGRLVSTAYLACFALFDSRCLARCVIPHCHG